GSWTASGEALQPDNQDCHQGKTMKEDERARYPTLHRYRESKAGICVELNRTHPTAAIETGWRATTGAFPLLGRSAGPQHQRWRSAHPGLNPIPAHLAGALPNPGATTPAVDP